MAKVHKKLLSTYFEYGTAGFRCKADLLDHVMYRMGMLAVLRARLLQASIGVMVTASHNPEEDNGVKLVDPAGEMMEESWEEVATKMANASDEDLQKIIDDLIKTHHILSTPSPPIIVAMDTRPSSKHLLQCVEDGVSVMEAVTKNFGELTTPQLHYIVRCSNNSHLGNSYYGEPTEQGYIEKLSTAFVQLNEGQGSKATLHVDGANGVGAKKLALLSNKIGNILELKVFQDGSAGKLNHMCGADFVKSNQQPPSGMPVDEGLLCCSFDGDADRVVFYCHDKDKRFQLLDGDKIAVLLAGYVGELLKRSSLHFKLGVVQTAYANGASTKFIQETIGVSVTCTATGVKNLHKAALKYDIGVYFEANGHGTILYKPAVLEAVTEGVKSSSPEISKACKDFLSFINLTNQTVGDAISDTLLVMSVLGKRRWGVDEWRGLYHDLPNKLLKIKIKERKAIETGDAERRVLKPASLQARIDQLVPKYPAARSFVRPSGTEDVVRVYAEAANHEDVKQLAWEVSCAVYEEAGGVGERPSL